MRSTNRPLRADAQRNRDKVIDAARAVIAAEGSSASMRTIAEAAGVGLATVYRQFPTKNAMLEGILREQRESLIALAEDLAEAADPEEAFREFFRAAVMETRYRQALFIEALAEAGMDLKSTSPESDPRMVSATEHLLSRVQEYGAVRDDIAMADLAVLLSAACFAVDRADPVRAERLITVLLDGLSTIDRTGMPGGQSHSA